ncbi:MAG TPA: Crp/Fnr family transcriptional regulator [Allosphingosinicella sp.]|nr:Crp/Fnr family transcriptional regulator [Allosphingosinicella sp.]
MPQLNLDASRNILIGSLPGDDFAALEPHLKRVPLDEGDVLGRFGEAIDGVCFPEAAVVSVSHVYPGGEMVEIGLIGICGMVGWPALLGAKESPHRAVVQVGGGSALRIDADIFLEVVERRPGIASLCLRFVLAFSIQLAGAAASNLRDPTEKRLARWLLMCHDRLEDDEIALTHHFIGEMLGVRRASVTDALHVLEGEGAIRSHRGLIIVRDRARLEAMAGAAYGFPEARYRELIGPFGKGAGVPG